MIVIGLWSLALFSVLSIVLGNEDPRRQADPRDRRSRIWVALRSTA